MTAKTTTAVGALVVAAGLLGFGTAHITGADAATRPRSDSTRRIAELESELATVREAERRLQDRVAVAEASRREPASAEANTPDTADPSPPRKSMAERLVEEAKALGVPDAVLYAARRADTLLAEGSPEANEAVRVLASHGEDAFKAVVALLRSGRSGAWFSKKLLPFTYRTGLESLLIDTAKREDLSSQSVGIAIGAMELADTPEVRDYLVQRVAAERNPTVVWYLANTLGALKEGRGAGAFADKLVFDDPIAGADWIPYRRGTLYHIGQMGGPQALRVLSDYARDPRIKAPADILAGLNALYAVDRKTCGELASLVLESPRSEAFDEERLQILSNLAQAK